MQKYVVSFCCILGFLSPMFAQTEYFKSFGSKDGMLSNDVYRVIQDFDNYIWICSEKGVMKFNGYTFKPFTVEQGLPVNDVWNIDLDTNNIIWLSMFTNGIYYIKNDSIITITQSKNIKNIQYLSGTLDTTYFYSSYTKKNYQYIHSNNWFSELNSNTDTYILCSNNNLKSYISANDDYYFVFSNNELTTTISANQYSLSSKSKKWNYFVNQKGEIWNNTLLLFTKDSITKVKINTQNNSWEPYNIYSKNNFDFWVFSNQNAKIYSQTNTNHSKLEKILNKVMEKGSKYISVLIDHENNYWISSVRNDLYFIPISSLVDYEFLVFFKNLKI